MEEFKFKPVISKEKNPNEMIKETILKNAGMIFSGAIKELSEAERMHMTGELSVEMIMDNLFPTNKFLRKEQDLKDEAKKYLEEWKNNKKGKDIKSPEGVKITISMVQEAWGAERRHGTKEED